MTPNKVRRCRRIINAPGYWRDRAVAEGEKYGAIVADFHSTFNYEGKDFGSSNSKPFKRMVWYCKHAFEEYRKANAEKECEKYDYDT